MVKAITKEVVARAKAIGTGRLGRLLLREVSITMVETTIIGAHGVVTETDGVVIVTMRIMVIIP